MQRILLSISLRPILNHSSLCLVTGSSLKFNRALLLDWINTSLWFHQMSDDVRGVETLDSLLHYCVIKAPQQAASVYPCIRKVKQTAIPNIWKSGLNIFNQQLILQTDWRGWFKLCCPGQAEDLKKWETEQTEKTLSFDHIFSGLCRDKPFKPSRMNIVRYWQVINQVIFSCSFVRRRPQELHGLLQESYSISCHGEVQICTARFEQSHWAETRLHICEFHFVHPLARNFYFQLDTYLHAAWTLYQKCTLWARLIYVRNYTTLICVHLFKQNIGSAHKCSRKQVSYFICSDSFLCF